MKEDRQRSRRGRRRRGRPRLSRNERRARALLVYTSMHWYFKAVSLGARHFPQADAEEHLQEACRDLGDDRAFFVLQSMGLPRIIKLARQGRAADLALNYTARYLKLPPEATRHLIREARVVFPNLEELIRRFAPQPRRVAFLRRWFRSRAAVVKRRVPKNLGDPEIEKERIDKASDELGQIMRLHPLGRVVQEVKWYVNLRYDLFTRLVTSHFGEPPAPGNLRRALYESTRRGERGSATDRVLLRFLIALGAEAFVRRYRSLAEAVIPLELGTGPTATISHLQVLLGLAIVRELTDAQLQAKFANLIMGMVGPPPKEWFFSDR